MRRGVCRVIEPFEEKGSDCGEVVELLAYGDCGSRRRELCRGTANYGRRKNCCEGFLWWNTVEHMGRKELKAIIHVLTRDAVIFVESSVVNLFNMSLNIGRLNLLSLMSFRYVCIRTDRFISTPTKLTL